MADSVIDIGIGNFVQAQDRIAIRGAEYVDLPIVVSGSVGIVRAKRWTALSQAPSRRENPSA
jgi:hypothetical protein